MKKKSIAFGAPGIEPRWTSSAKDGIGTAYHSASCIWFTLSHGIVNEIYWLFRFWVPSLVVLRSGGFSRLGGHG